MIAKLFTFLGTTVGRIIGASITVIVVGGLTALGLWLGGVISSYDVNVELPWFDYVTNTVYTEDGDLKYYSAKDKDGNKIYFDADGDPANIVDIISNTELEEDTVTQIDGNNDGIGDRLQ